MSEIEAFPRAVLHHHYGDVPLHGNFTTIKAGQFEPIDLLVGGTPCQSFSISGLRGGLEDARGNLALEYLRLADRLRPRWVVWENVPGVLSSLSHPTPDSCAPPDNMEEGAEWVGEDEYDSDESNAFECFLAGLSELGYGWAYRSLDAQYFGLAQRRERVFVVGYLGDWRLAAAVLFEPASLRGDPPPSRKARKDVAPTISARTKGGGGLGTDFDLDGGLIASALRSRDSARGVDSDCTDTLVAFSCKDHAADAGYLAPTLRAMGHAGSHANAGGQIAVAYGGNNTAGPIDVATAVNNAHGGPHGRLDFESETFVTHALRADGFDASEDGTGRGTPMVPVAFDCKAGANTGFAIGDVPGALRGEGHGGGHAAVHTHSAVRRLTPRECCRLQGFPDDYLDITYRGKPASDGPKYKALGNSFAVPVIRWIGIRLGQIDEIT